MRVSGTFCDLSQPAGAFERAYVSLDLSLDDLQHLQILLNHVEGKLIPYGTRWKGYRDEFADFLKEAIGQWSDEQGPKNRAPKEVE